MRVAVAWLERALFARVNPEAHEELELWLAGEDGELHQKRNDEAKAALAMTGGEIG